MRHFSPAFNITIRLHLPNTPGKLGRVTSAIGEADGLIGEVDIISVDRNVITRDITISTADVEHGKAKPPNLVSAHPR